MGPLPKMYMQGRGSHADSPLNPIFSFLYIIPKNFLAMRIEIFKITLYNSTGLCYNLWECDLCIKVS